MAARKLATIASILVLAYLAFDCQQTMLNPGKWEPRATVADFAGDFLREGREALARGDLRGAEARFIYVLNIGGPNADAYCGLAHVAAGRGQCEKARRLVKKCLAQDPRHAGALRIRANAFAVNCRPMDIALIKPSWRYPIAGADHPYNRRWPPLELLNCAAILEARGHAVRLIDAQAEDLPPEKVAARLGRAEMAIVTSSALDRWQCPTLELAPLVATIEKLRPCAGKILLTGFHGSVKPAELLDLAGVDAVIRGEPESVVAEVAAGCPWRDVPGLTFRADGQVVSNPERPPLDMTTLPLPAIHLLDLRHYDYEILGRRFLVLEGSRGCPYPCTFCSRVIQGKPLRQKTVEQLGAEVETAVRKFGVESIYFIDLEFTALPKLVTGLCEFILSRGLRFRWCCQTRTDKVDEPLLRLMKRAGCRLVHFGVESGSERIVEMTKKRVTIARQVEGVELARRAGMEVLCFFLLGYPGETEEEMRATVRLARRLNPTYASFHRISPYPGTPIYEQLAAGNKELFPAFAGTEEDRRRVDAMIREAIWSFYMRPGYILPRLFRASPASWWRQLRLFAGYFR